LETQYGTKSSPQRVAIIKEDLSARELR